jgi:type IV secretory pathway VirJ component
VTDWSPVFLGVIAAAVVVMACIQIGAIVAAVRLAQRVNRLAERVEHDLAPVVANLQTIGAEAARASALATAQVERADRLFADVTARVDETVSAVQQAVMVPAREGLAVMAGLRAALVSLREAWQTQTGRRGSRPDEDDPLFIG